MRVYVSGPVSGHIDLNRHAFEKARYALAERGFTPLVPHDFVSPNADWQAAMRRSLETLAKADGVALLDGWQDSHGAALERYIALKLSIPCGTLDTWLNLGPPRTGFPRRRCPMCKRLLPTACFAGSRYPCLDCWDRLESSGGDELG